MHIGIETLKAIAEVCECLEAWEAQAEISKFGLVLRASKRGGRAPICRARIISWEEVARADNPLVLVAGNLRSMTGSYVRRPEGWKKWKD